MSLLLTNFMCWGLKPDPAHTRNVLYMPVLKLDETLKET